jgi:hypothetical protein
VSTTEELLERKISGSGLESREYDRRDPLCCPRDTLYPRNLSLTSPTSGGICVGIVRSRTQATEFRFIMKSSVHFRQNCGSEEDCITKRVGPICISSMSSSSIAGGIPFKILLYPEVCALVYCAIDRPT